MFGERSALGCIKSSMFMSSTTFDVFGFAELADFRSCVIPLGL